MSGSRLFSPFALRDVTFRNRVFVSPMCQYSSDGGLPTDWHLVHLGSRAVGGAGLVCVEASAVTPEGRISPADSGIWSDAHARAFRTTVAFIAERGAVPGIQLAHAGRKASTDAPWRGGKPLDPEQGGWTPLAPSAVPFDEGYPVPHALTGKEIDGVVEAFAAAARRARIAGFKVVELHMAHGYLVHQFLSPLANQRKDAYGGSLENRARLALRITHAVRDAWPSELPLFVRISATDWVKGGWNVTESVQLVRWLKDLGVDLVDCSSGGVVPKAKIPVGPGYQTAFAERIRRETGILTGAIGLITEPVQAEHVLRTGQADVVFLAREMLRDPYFPLRAARALGVDIPWPEQYLRARP